MTSRLPASRSTNSCMPSHSYKTAPGDDGFTSQRFQVPGFRVQGAGSCSGSSFRLEPAPGTWNLEPWNLSCSPQPPHKDPFSNLHEHEVRERRSGHKDAEPKGRHDEAESGSEGRSGQEHSD